MTNQEKPYYCASLTRLSQMAEQFILDDKQSTQQREINDKLKNNSNAPQKDITFYLNQCIHILSNYKDQCKLLKNKYSIALTSSTSNENVEHLDKEILVVLESSYIYYKIIHLIILTKIPNLPEFQSIKRHLHDSVNKKDKDLMEIYNGLVKTLLNDENILQIKWFLKKNSRPPQPEEIPPSNNDNDNDINENDSGSIIPYNDLINRLLKDTSRNDILFIDIRTKNQFDSSHVDMPNVICLEPISFKEMYSDIELEKKSMITATDDEVELFNKRNKFKFIILYTDSKDELMVRSQNILSNILLHKSFEKPLDDSLTKVYLLQDGFDSWIQNGGKVKSSSSKKSTEKETPKVRPKPNSTNSVYLDGDTSGLNLKPLPKMVPSVSHSMDKSMRDMMSNTSTLPSGYSSNISRFNDSISVMSRQVSNGNLPKRTSSLKRLSQLLPSFKTSQSPLSPPPQRDSTSSPRLSHMYSDSTSAISLSSPPHIVSHRDIANNSSSNTTYTSYPDPKNLLRQQNDVSESSLTNPVSVSSPPQLPKLPQKIMSPSHQPISTSSTNLPSAYHTRSYSSPSSSTPNISSPLTSNDKNNSMSSQIGTETLHKQYDLDFIVGLENMGNSCYLNCIIQCLLGTHELTKIFLNNSYERHINLNSKLGSKGVLAKNFARLVNTMYNHALATGKNSSTQRQLTNGSNNNNSSSSSSITSSLLMRKKEPKVTPVRPQQFRVACGSVNSLFKDCSQQDCQEFCQFLLDGLHEDLNQNGGNPPLKELSKEAEEVREKLSLRIASSIEWERFLTTDFSVILDLFQGQYASRLQCKVCETTSTTYQPFSVLSIPVPQSKDKSSVNIIDCFNEFTKVENLETDEQWSCPHCKKKQPSTKKLTITRLPKNLIIHLKRFDNRLNKNNNMINYPFTLDLTEFWADDFDGRLPTGVTNELPTRGQVPPFNYKLYGVACHFGSLYGGHYTAYVDKGIGKGWYYFDDTNYRTIKNPNEPITSNAYVLFYKRVYGGI